MAIYNTQEYLCEAIDSIINQTIGFKDNVQLILVNDGSQDDSKEIILDYQNKFPENITVINQENQGQASARNNGLKYVNADYVNFLDSDDYLAGNALEEVYPFFEKYKNEIDIVSIPITFFGRKNEPHMLNNKFTSSRIIDLSVEHNAPQLSSSSAFFKYDLFDKYEFPTNVLFSEDSILINKILLDNPFYGVVNTTEYFYRKRFDETSTIDVVHTKKEYFADKLKDYFLYLFEYADSKFGEIPYFLQYTLTYDLQWIFYEDLSILDEKEESDFWFYLKKVLSYIDGDIILENQYIRNDHLKEFFYSVKKDNFHMELLDDDVMVKIGDYVCSILSNHNLWLDIVNFRDGYLTLSGFCNTLIDSKYLSFEAVKCQGDSITESFLAKTLNYTSRPNVEFLSKTYQFNNNFDVVIPINDNEESTIRLKLNFHKDGNNNNFDSGNVLSLYLDIQFTDHAKLNRFSNYKIDNSNLLFYKENVFYIIPYSFKRFIKKELTNIYYINHEVKRISEDRVESFKQIIKLRLLYLFTYPFYRIFYRNKKIFLFEDRIDVADDNAFYLFRYANTVKDNVKKYFVLSKDAKQYEKVSEMGKILIHGSFKHKFFMFFANKIISTHPYETVINPFWSYEANQRHLVAGLLDYKIYFLQHGVTKDDISSWMYKYDKDLSLIVTVSEMESKSFFNEGYGYDESIIQNLGFPRFDYLEDNDEKQILIIPTWRKNLRGEKNLFKNSIYFESINSLLNNEKLIDMSKNGYNVIFRPHPELIKCIEDSDERYIELFDIPDEIKLSYDESYQELFNSSSVLVTDYSSVFFDFAYLKKPVIYYHPADDYHYENSYFDYETMGFGDVVKFENDLIDKLDSYIKNDCIMEEKYKKRVDEFFTYSDRNNCKRVYDWIYKD